jgi:hypothetical protein
MNSTCGCPVGVEFSFALPSPMSQYFRATKVSVPLPAEVRLMALPPRVVASENCPALALTAQYCV